MKDKKTLMHTIGDCHLAKHLLIETLWFSESQFDNATQMDLGLGYILGEPLLISGDDCISALDLYNSSIINDEFDSELDL